MLIPTSLNGLIHTFNQWGLHYKGLQNCEELNWISVRWLMSVNRFGASWKLWCISSGNFSAPSWQLLWMGSFTTWAEAISHRLHKYNDQTHIWSRDREINSQNFGHFSRNKNLNTFTHFKIVFFYRRSHPLFHWKIEVIGCDAFDVLVIGSCRAKLISLQKLKQNLSISLNFITHPQKIKRDRQFILPDEIALNNFRIILELIKTYYVLSENLIS